MPTLIKFDQGDFLLFVLGAAQREPALSLVSVLVSVLGIEAILPPYTTDTKFINLLTHLTCIEVRMVLENSSMEEVLHCITK